MPVYPYRCGVCRTAFEQFEHADGSHQVAKCKCGALADRVWTMPYANVDNTEAHFNNGLGQVVKSKGDIRDAQKRYYDTTGSHLLELGTDTKWRAKRQRQEYAYGSELAG